MPTGNHERLNGGAIAYYAARIFLTNDDRHSKNSPANSGWNLRKIHLCLGTGLRPFASQLVAVSRRYFRPTHSMLCPITFHFVDKSGSTMTRKEICYPLFAVNRDDLRNFVLCDHFICNRLHVLGPPAFQNNYSDVTETRLLSCPRGVPASSHP
jgi:hypothetical protein